MQKTRPKYASVYKCEQRVSRLTKICLIIQGDLCLEKPYKAILALCLQKFVYITWSHDQFCLQKSWQELYKAIYALKRLTRRFFKNLSKTIQFKSLEARAMLLALKKKGATISNLMAKVMVTANLFQMVGHIALSLVRHLDARTKSYRPKMTNYTNNLKVCLMAILKPYIGRMRLVKEDKFKIPSLEKKNFYLVMNWLV